MTSRIFLSLFLLGGFLFSYGAEAVHADQKIGSAALASRKQSPAVTSINIGKIISDIQHRKPTDNNLSFGAIVSDFLDVAFTDTISDERVLREHFESTLTNLNSNTQNDPVSDSYAARFPQLAPFIYSKRDHWPKSNVINKWNEKVTIGVGFPPGEKNIITPALRSIVEGQIRSQLPALQKITGLEIKYIAPEEETAQSYAKLRIMIDHGLPSTGLDEPGISVSPEDMLWGAVFFEDVGKGYFGATLPKSDNTMGFSYCFLQSRQPMPLVRSLINRCLLRSVGLPNLSTRKKIETVLGKEGLPKEWPSDKKPIDTSENPEAPPTNISEYDLRLLSFLYCHAIKPGMSKIEAIQVIAQRRECPLPK